MNRMVIETTNLAKHYKTLKAVDGIDLAVPESSVYGFLGPNGAGKTTTIRMLLGLIKPTGGTVKLFGHDIAADAHRRVLLKHVGALVEMPALYKHLTGRENLEVTRRLLDIDKKHLDRVLDIVRLQDAAHRLAGEYSLGMKQRLGLALAMLNEPKLLILDEPTNGLDPAGIHEIRDLIRSLPEQYGITVFLSSNLLSEIEQMATHIGIVNHGRMRYQDTLHSLQAQQRSQLKLGVRQPDAAYDLLRESGWIVSRVNGHLSIDIHSEADAAAINTSLVSGGMDVYHLNLERENLEAMFLQMTD
ncbi:MAG TPA: ABC transporter ATP-binding protein, partial [Aggregatilineales bacterium]|nr:ABC transporter ATP-binding protein [Aggregatilineales bacterium]